jgi:hypothetical protein
MDLKVDLAKFGLARQKPVGRLLGSRLQAHRLYEKEVVPKSILKRARHAAAEYSPVILRLYNAVQYNVADFSMSFDYSPDFDFTDEPMLAASFTVHADGTSQFIPIDLDPIIWQHRWMWVKDDYPGFSVSGSMQRSLYLCGLRDPAVSRRIHRKAAWLDFLDREGKTP